jgi:sugar phosphate isomerase/epimerase
MKNTNNTRRDFIKKLGLGSAGLIALSSLGSNTLFASEYSEIKRKALLPGLQLYTIREALKTDLIGSLKRIREIGYTQVELAGYDNGKFYGIEPLEFKKITDDLGIDVVSSHTAVEKQGITADNAKLMAEAHSKLGVQYCVQPWIEAKDRTLESYKRLIQLFNQTGEIMKEFDIRFAYHNHDFDFDTIDGVIPYFDVFLKESDPNLVNFEIDLYWTIKAGQDPVKLFNNYPGRFPLWHVKDMENSPDRFFAPIGAGTIDFKRIFQSREIAGMEHFFVEQDASRDNKPFDAIKTSYTNLVSNILTDS